MTGPTPAFDPTHRFLEAGGDVRGGTRSLAGGVSTSVAAHAAVFLLLVFAIGSSSDLGETPSLRELPRLVWNAGPAGGGGGGGEQKTTPARAVRVEGRSTTNVPAFESRARHADRDMPEPVRPEVPVAVPAELRAAALDSLPGAIAAVDPAGLSRGSGSGPGADGGRGPGSGGGDGAGFADGQDFGTGGEAGMPGNGVTWPRLLREIKPAYTADAMRARIQGFVLLEVVVQEDGSVGRIRLLRSLDAAFGLDEEAVKAVRKWQFAPARHRGTPVAVRVPVEVHFMMR